MKNVVRSLFFVLLVFSAIDGVAQESGVESHNGFALKGGLNLNLTTTTFGNMSGVGAYLGGVMGVDIGGGSSFRFELLASFRQSGLSSESVLMETAIENTITTSPLFASIPLLYRYQLSENIGVVAGPRIDILLVESGEQTVVVGGVEKTTTTSASLSRLDLGFDIGGDYRLTDNLALELRYGRTLLSLLDSDFSDGLNVIQLGGIYFL